MGYSMFVSGLTHWDEKRAYAGFTVYSAQSGAAFYLIDLAGKVAHEWRPPTGMKAFYGHLLESGNLLAGCTTGAELSGPGGGHAAAVVELDWDGNVVWQYLNPAVHHDHARLRNGNTAVVASEILDPAQAATIKGAPAGEPVRSEQVLEIAPDGSTVWEWHAHLSLDSALFQMPAGPGTGPLGGGTPAGGREWLHCNAVEELPNGDLILSFNSLSTMVIVDRKSGDVKWRLDPSITQTNHNPTWQPDGKILLFDNGNRRGWSRVIEVDPATQAITWEYRGSPRESFLSASISSAQRLPNGNTFICEGRPGRLFEVTPDCEIVWEYINPFEFDHLGQPRNRSVFRAYRYAADSPEIRNRV